MAGKLMSMAEAVGTFVRDGDTLVIEGFTHLICFAAGHEIIRQKKRDLVACRLTPDLIYDQMVAASCVRKLVFSWAGNPGVGSLFGLRRAVEQGVPRRVEIEEYSHFGMVARLGRSRRYAQLVIIAIQSLEVKITGDIRIPQDFQAITFEDIFT